MKRIQVLAQKRRKREEDRAAAQAEAHPPRLRVSWSLQPGGLGEGGPEGSGKGHLSSSEVVEAADALRARYGL